MNKETALKKIKVIERFHLVIDSIFFTFFLILFYLWYVTQNYTLFGRGLGIMAVLSIIFFVFSFKKMKLIDEYIMRIFDEKKV